VTPRPLHAVLLTGPDAPERLYNELRAALDGSGPALLPLDPGLPPARLRELLAAFAPTSIVTTEGTDRLQSAKAGHQSGSGVAEDVALVLTTSGSTGVPKGAELTASALLASARASLARLGAGSGRWLCCLPTHHISGLGVLTRSVLTGTDPVIADQCDAATVADTDCEFVSLVPTQLSRLLAAAAPVAKFRAVLLGGAAAPADLLEAAAAAGARVVSTYGMTETCGGCVYDGVPLAGVRVGTGADGRVKIAGPVLFARYRLAPDLTEANLADGWFTTSDLGGLGDDGRLALRGRADDVINTGGEKVVPGEVERVLQGCPGVREVAVVGVPDPDWGERVTAVVVAAGQATRPTLADLREVVQKTLPRHAAPHKVVYLEALPMLASGKPDRLRLREIAAGRI
jgi:o-succinylbenzoate---CoA ligase